MSRSAAPGPHWLQQISPVLRPTAEQERTRSHTASNWAARGWHEPKRVIYDHQLVLVSQGVLSYEIEGQALTLRAGEYVLIPPGVWHASWNAAGERVRRHWIHFDWTWRGDYERTPLATVFPARPDAARYRPAPEFAPAGWQSGTLAAPQEAYDLMARLEAKMLGSRHDRLAGRALLLELLILLFDRSGDRRPARKTERLALQVQEQLRRYVQTASGAERTIEDLLRELGYSYSYLARVFHRSFGLTPVQYLHALRIDRAIRLLRDTDLPVAQIARKTGYADTAYFSRVFRQHTQSAPRDYRNR